MRQTPVNKQRGRKLRNHEDLYTRPVSDVCKLHHFQWGVSHPEVLISPLQWDFFSLSTHNKTVLLSLDFLSEFAY